MNRGQVLKLGHNCSLQQDHFKADMSEDHKKRLFVPGLVTKNTKGVPTINPSMLHDVRRTNYITRPPDEVGELPTRLVAAAFNDDSPSDDAYKPQADYGGKNGSFHLAKADQGGFYSMGAESAIVKFEAANTEPTKLAVLRDLVYLACAQNGVPFAEESFIFPSEVVLQRYEKKPAARKPKVPRSATGYSMWLKQLDHKAQKGEWVGLPKVEKTKWIAQAAQAATGDEPVAKTRRAEGQAGAVEAAASPAAAQAGAVEASGDQPCKHLPEHNQLLPNC